MRDLYIPVDSCTVPQDMHAPTQFAGPQQYPCSGHAACQSHTWERLHSWQVKGLREYGKCDIPWLHSRSCMRGFDHDVIQICQGHQEVLTGGSPSIWATPVLLGFHKVTRKIRHTGMVQENKMSNGENRSTLQHNTAGFTRFTKYIGPHTSLNSTWKVAGELGSSSCTWSYSRMISFPWCTETLHVQITRIFS